MSCRSFSSNPLAGLRRPNFGTLLVEWCARGAQQDFRTSDCVNADDFIFFSNKKQLVASLDSNIFCVVSLVAFAVEAPMNTSSQVGTLREMDLNAADAAQPAHRRHSRGLLAPMIHHALRRFAD